MNELFAQVETPNIWNGEHGSSALLMKVVIGAVLGLLLIAALTKAPPRVRNWIVMGATFLAGLFYVLFWAWPRPQPPVTDTDIPQGAVESVAYWLRGAIPRIADISQILTTFILGLGVYSLLRIHVSKFVKRQKDWPFSVLLLLAMFSMIGFGYGDYIMRQGPEGAKYLTMDNWGAMQYGRDLLFDGFLQNMDAAMFSLIAFFIMSAAYRAFRVRSIESTILLATALIMMISLMGAVVGKSDALVDAMGGSDPGAFVNNLRFSEIAGWIKDNIQTPAINGMQFGIGVGALAMGLRLWLSLEKAGGNS